jgi:uncharacterized phiE125 gp8 family phage protein
MARPVLFTAPAVEPVTAVEAKAHLRIDSDVDDVMIGTLIVAARKTVEDLTGRALITQTWRQSWDYRFPCDFRLPKGSLQSVASLTYVDNDGATQTLGSGAYQVDADSEPGRVIPAYGTSWPTTRSQPVAVTITWSCGYGSAGTDIPEPIRQTILMLVAHWYDSRQPSDVPSEIASMLTPYRLWVF